MLPDTSEGPHAARWITRKLGPERFYSKWHYTTDATWTMCGKMIPIMDKFDAKFPETQDDLGVIDCKVCVQTLRPDSTGRTA